MKSDQMLLRAMAWLLVSVSAAWAAGGEPVGTIKRSEGAVSIQRGGATLPGTVGTELFVGDRVRTGADGSAGITLSDDTRLSAGPGSALLINEYTFNTTSHEGSMLASFLKGTFSVVTGLIAKENAGAVKFKTPTSTLGIRGTEFVVDVQGPAD
jgi:hypothetical protein